ncbi:prophage endopeptidase tail family protein [Clostridium sp. ZBS18]|uniref:prophage endopeptidase tail family protein n=1 Tax=Clostridium sp. ZBS18 TaxID=2949967 RepID=UPI00207ADE34|nr:prophage endopeptidase tail family protein [Clostridium sp. ZBS18]
MEEIKERYLNPVPVLFICKGIPENTLVSNDFDTAYNITLTKNDNEVSQLTFSIPFTINRKVNYDDCEKLVLFENEYYIIKDIQEDNVTRIIKVTCKHESIELKGVYCEPIKLIGVSPKAMFDKIMTSTKHPYNTSYKFKGTDVPSDKKRHLITENEASVYENLVSMAKVFNGWLEFSTDNNGQNWIFLRTQTIKNNKYVKQGLDMKALNISYNSDELFTRVQPFGAKDKYGIEINIMSVNPTKQSYVENYSWYLKKGIPMEVIKREAKYQQFKQMHMDEYTDAKDLYEFALEELQKCCVPKLEATLDMQDLSIYVDSLDEPPEIGYEITCINPDIDFILSCQITGVERNYDNPMATKVTIANFIRYDTVFQNINHGAEAGDRVTSNDSSNGTYVPEKNIQDGDHINLDYKLNDYSTKITENAEEIRLTAKDTQDNKAELIVQAKAIEQKVESEEFNTYKKQTDREISQKVSSGSEFSSELRQNVEAFQFLFNEASGKMTEITKEGISIYDGGLLVYDEHKNLVFSVLSNGTVRLGNVSVQDLQINNLEKDGGFYYALSHMKEMWIKDVGIGKLVIDSEAFRISDDEFGNGYNLWQYIKKCLQYYKLI